MFFVGSPCLGLEWDNKAPTQNEEDNKRTCRHSTSGIRPSRLMISPAILAAGIFQSLQGPARKVIRERGERTIRRDAQEGEQEILLCYRTLTAQTL